MDLANVALTVVLSMIALGVFIVRAVKWTMRAMLIEEGLIRAGRDGKHWPDGWHNLPDTLEGILAEMKTHHAKDSH